MTSYAPRLLPARILAAVSLVGALGLPLIDVAAAGATASVPGRPAVEVTETALEDATVRLVAPPVMRAGEELPAIEDAEVSWRSNTPGVAVNEGRLTLEGATPVVAKVEATVAAGGETASKEFTVRVLPTGSSRLLASYTRVPTGSDQANQDVIARSMHLALGDDAASLSPLFDNYGVLFGSSVPVGLDRVENRSLADPYVYRRGDGEFGVVALRRHRDGSSDGTEQSKVVVYRSPDLVDYGDPVLVDVGSTGGVAKPRAVHDSARGVDVLTWVDGAGRARWATFGDLSEPDSRIATGEGAVDTGPPVPALDGVSDARPSGAVVVEGQEAARLRERFGRIRNVSASVEPVTVQAGSALDLSGARALLGYSDGSTASRAVSWYADDVADVDTSSPGTYQVRGTIRAPRHVVPFAHNRADPAVYRYDRGGDVQYLMVATDDAGGNNIGSYHLPIRGAATLAGLSDQAGGATHEVDLLNRLDGNPERNTQGKVIAGCYWAPELHEIGGRLTILFSPCFNSGDDQSNTGADWRTVQSHVMQLRAGGDPLDPADWSTPAPVLQADGTPLQRAGHPGISLDMTYLVNGDDTYYVWSQRVTSGEISDPGLWIARVDPADATRVTGPLVQIVEPRSSWEEQLAEGAFALHHDGRIHLVYSSSGVSPTYVVGAVRADVDADLMDPGSWDRYEAPLQKSEPRQGTWHQSEQGPGHGAFTQDGDGNLLYAYHTWDDGGRDTRLRRVHWAADGRPVLDMSYAEEVAPDLRVVTVTVTVSPPPAPVATQVPQIRGRAEVGAVLSASTGTWDQTGLRFNYRWYRGSAPIPGATAARLVVRPADVGRRLSVVVTARTGAGGTGTAHSASTNPAVRTTATIAARVARSGQRLRLVTVHLTARTRIPVTGVVRVVAANRTIARIRLVDSRGSARVATGRHRALRLVYSGSSAVLPAAIKITVPRQ